MNRTSQGSLEQLLLDNIMTPASEMTPEAELAARKEILWCIGTSIAGASAPGSREIAEYVSDVGGRPEATVFGTGERVPAHMAVFANSTYAKALEFEDKTWIGTTHGFGVGMAVVPAALAAADVAGGIDQKAFVEAVAVATDFHIRLISAVPNSTFGKSGFNSSYVFWVFGATAAACKVMGLSREETSNALGLAYAQAAGNYQGQVEGVLGVRLQGGFAGRNAIMAAQLASRGVTGVQNFFTGAHGLYPLYFGHITPDLDAVTADLGREYRGERLGFKAYPCGLVCQGAIDSLRGLLAHTPIDASSVSAVRVYGGDRLLIMTEPREHRRNPRNFVEAQFSAPWAMACTLVYGTLGLKHLGEETLNDPRCRRLSNLVDVDIDPQRKEQFVEIELEDGTVHRSDGVAIPRGHPDNPLSVAEISGIFSDCLDAGPSATVAKTARELPRLILGADEDRFDNTEQISQALLG